MSKNNLTHFDAAGNAVMVDVSGKPVTAREATARGILTMNAEAFAAVQSGTVKKGDVLAVAQVAGIQAAKHNWELIPMCHPLPLTGIDITFALSDSPCMVEIQAAVTCTGVTGVEMEALTAVSVAALTIYDMCKAVQKDMRIENIRLLSKSGGKSGDFKRGMGLGLSLCRSIVEVHGGTLQVRNRKPCGSEFWFTLPAVDAEDVVARSVEAVRG